MGADRCSPNADVAQEILLNLILDFLLVLRKCVNAGVLSTEEGERLYHHHYATIATLVTKSLTQFQTPIFCRNPVADGS